MNCNVENNTQLLEQYESLVRDYEYRVNKIKQDEDSGKDTSFDKRTLELFDNQLQEIKPKLMKKILFVERILRAG
jgi:hypothetical protein